MGVVNITDLKPGMVLSTNILDDKNRLLLSRGTCLNARQVEIIREKGITEVEIDGMEQAEIDAQWRKGLDPALCDLAEKSTRERFRHTNLETEATRELFRLSVARKARLLNRSGGKELEEQNSISSDNTELLENGFCEKLSLGALLHQEDLKLPSLPAIFVQIRDVISQPSSSASQISNVIDKDTSLSAKLLRIVNSALYGRMTKVDSLSRAVTIIGTRQLSELALGVSVLSVFKDIPSELINMKMFWAHSTAVAIATRSIAGQLKMEGSERPFIAGLLHDIGRLILFQYYSESARTVLLKARASGELLYETEENLLGLDHAIIGGRALKKWQFPPALVEAVAYHHQPRKATHLTEATLVHVADCLVNAMGIGSSGEVFVPPFNKGIWTSLGLPPSIIAPTMQEVDHQLNRIVKSLFSES